jgi:transposase
MVHNKKQAGCIMYLKKSTVRNGRVYLSIAEGNYDPATKRTKTANIKKLGYLDELMKEHADPIAYFTAEINKMNADREVDKTAMTVAIDSGQRVEAGSRKNFGYVALSAIYHELGIHLFLANRQQSMDVGYNMNSIMRLLVFSRLIDPGSKKKAYDGRDRFFERGDFGISDMYRALSRFAGMREELQLWMHERVVAGYGRDTSVVYYDVTNFYFEIDEQDELRKKGVSKEHRPEPIVQMGLLMDNGGIPVSYQLFPGNANDCATLLPVIRRIRKTYETGKAVVVSDKGLNTGKNAYYLANSRGGYVFSQTVRGGNAELKKYVLAPGGYEQTGPGSKKKSRQFTRKVEFEDDSGQTVKAEIAEKQVAIYSRSYAEKARADRAAAVAKAHAIIRCPKNFNKQNTYGSAKYIRQISFDKKTGEILEAKSALSFNDELLAEEEKYDGYYVIATNRHDKPDDWVMDTYHELWRIEETFKVTKSDLEARPVYVSRHDRIEAHFLICFVSLLIVRLLQKRLGNSFPAARILDSLSKTCCSHLKENVHMFDYCDEVMQQIGLLFDIDFGQKFRTQAEIKKIVAHAKKSFVAQ